MKKRSQPLPVTSYGRERGRGGEKGGRGEGIGRGESVSPTNLFVGSPDPFDDPFAPSLPSTSAYSPKRVTPSRFSPSHSPSHPEKHSLPSRPSPPVFSIKDDEDSGASYHSKEGEGSREFLGDWGSYEKEGGKLSVWEDVDGEKDRLIFV